MPKYLSHAEFAELERKDLSAKELLTFIGTRFVAKRSRKKPVAKHRDPVGRVIRGGTIYMRYQQPYGGREEEYRFSTGIKAEDPLADTLIAPWYERARTEQAAGLRDWLKTNRNNPAAKDYKRIYKWIMRNYPNLLHEGK